MTTLFDFMDIEEVEDEALSPQQRFERFHSNNKHVYVALRQVALDLVERGQERISINMCFEVVRWQQFMRTNDDTPYKMNNTYRSRYARMLMDTEPKLAGVFETRRLHSVE